MIPMATSSAQIFYEYGIFIVDLFTQVIELLSITFVSMILTILVDQGLFCL